MTVRRFIDADTDGQQLVIGEGQTRDDLQTSGRWIATPDPVDVAAWR